MTLKKAAHAVKEMTWKANQTKYREVSISCLYLIDKKFNLIKNIFKNTKFNKELQIKRLEITKIIFKIIEKSYRKKIKKK